MFSEFLVYLTVFGVFSESLKLTYGIDFKFFYVIVLLASGAVLLHWDFRLNRYHCLVLLYLAISGLAGVFTGTDRMAYYLQQVIGIAICSTYFYIFLSHQDIKKVFELYARFAYYVCWIGLFTALIASLLTSQFHPIRGIMTEPEHFGTVMLPAAFFYAFRAIHLKRQRKEAVVTALAVFFSGSATAFVGIMLALALLLKKRVWTLFFGLLIASSFGSVMYTFDQHTRERVDGMVQTLKLMDATEASATVYATVSNIYVASRVLAEHPWFGVGLGGHRVAHDKYIDELPGAAEFEGLIDTNALDGSALLLRTASELGIVGVCLLLSFIVRFYVRGDSEAAVLNNAVLVYFALKLLREGHWFAPETYFFVWVYVFAWMLRKRESHAANPENERAAISA